MGRDQGEVQYTYHHVLLLVRDGGDGRWCALPSLSSVSCQRLVQRVSYSKTESSEDNEGEGDRRTGAAHDIRGRFALETHGLVQRHGHA